MTEEKQKTGCIAQTMQTGQDGCTAQTMQSGQKECAVQNMQIEQEARAVQRTKRSRRKFSADIIIPVYRPKDKFLKLMRMLAVQSHPIGKIILMNTEKAFWTPEAEQLCREIASGENAVGSVELYHIAKQEFDHAATRRAGIAHSDAEVFVCMTDDAVPADEYLIERLLDALSKSEETSDGKPRQERDGVRRVDGQKESSQKADGQKVNSQTAGRQEGSGSAPIAEAYARQLPTEECGEAERFTRVFNYPETSYVKSAEDLSQFGIKTYFASNVCCAYRRDIYDRLGGFCSNAIFNEDMIFAAKAVQAGCRIAYCADAKVLHAHRYTALQQLHRNFDLGMSQAMHPEVFSGLKSEGEGIRLVKETALYLLRTGHAAQVPGLFWQSAFKYLGFRMGRAYRRMPYRFCLRLAMNRTYLEKHRAELWEK